MEAPTFSKTRAYTALLLVAAASLAAGCGEDDFENEPRAPVPIELTGVIQERGVSVQPKEVGAGPILITISNQTQEAHTVTLDGDTIEERVGPIAPQDTATIQKTVKPGTYEVRAGSAEAVGEEIPPAELTIGPRRDASNDRLLLP
jgi:hypothetical protein